MGFGEAISSGFQNYVGFAGRAPRSEFWYWILFVLLLDIAAIIVDAVLGLGIVSALVGLAVFLPSLAVSVRRLHDRDYSGSWILLAFTGIGLADHLVLHARHGRSKQVRLRSASSNADLASADELDRFVFAE